MVVMMIVIRIRLVLQPAADIGDLGRRIVEAADENSSAVPASGMSPSIIGARGLSALSRAFSDR